jgi:2-polyprenyl-3-methyl-5-hydroxy-6-metoxy-1,4-benzoquinol methylase
MAAAAAVATIVSTEGKPKQGPVRAAGEGHRAMNRGRTAEEIAAQRANTIAAAKAEGLRKKAEYVANKLNNDTSTVTVPTTTITSPSSSSSSSSSSTTTIAATSSSMEEVKIKTPKPKKKPIRAEAELMSSTKKELSDEVDADLAHGGASPFGNFHQYYNFNPAAERVRHFPSRMGAHIIQTNDTNNGNNDNKSGASSLSSSELSYLDIGCNEGDLTIAVAHHLATSMHGIPVRALGVDLDTLLIDRASHKPVTQPTSAASSSPTATPTHVLAETKVSVTFRCCDVMKETDVVTHVAPFIPSGIYISAELRYKVTHTLLVDDRCV